MSRSRWRREYLISVTLAGLLGCSSANNVSEVDAGSTQGADAPVAPPVCTTEAAKRGPEVCDDVDNDCNGIIDDVANLPSWYPDKDGDKFGDSNAPRFQCKKPEGYTDVGGDCDD